MKAIERISPATLHLAELAWLAGRASLLGAHEIPGCVWWRVDEVLPTGTVLLTLWGPDKVEAWRMVDASRPAGTQVVLHVLPANRWRRMQRWLASRWWRLVLLPLRLRARGRV